MRKLKLESLRVESFETTAGSASGRGTVEGHAVAPNTPYCGGTAVSLCVVCEPRTYDPAQCGETNYLDCTFGCSAGCSNTTGCDLCWVDRTPTGPVG
ncbi:MAG TPA: pinensin family lanthipeptide [Longimicrobium sp.]